MNETQSVDHANARRRGFARNAMHLGLGQVATTALAALLGAAIARTLGAADFGLLYLLTSIAAFAYVFVDWGHGPYVTREIARNPERSGELIGSVLVVRVAMTFLACALAVSFTWLLGYDMRTRLLTAYMILAQLPMYIALTYAWAFRGHERMDCDAMLSVVLKLAMFVISVVALAFGGRLLALIPVFTVAGIIAIVVATMAYKRLGLPALRVSRATAKELVVGGAPMLAIALGVAVQPYIDANILYKLVPQAVLGWYGAAWVIAGTLVAPATILGSTLYPQLSRAASDDEEFRRALTRAFRPLLLVAVLGGVGTFLFADFAVGVVYSKEKFGPAASILQAFAPALILIYVDMLLGYAILAVGKAGNLAKAKVAAIIVTTVAELALIPWFQSHYGNGGIGIVLAIAGGELVMVTTALMLIRHVVEPKVLLDLGRGLLGGAATIFVMKSVSVHPLAAIPATVVIFAGFSLAVGLIQRSDLELLSSIIRRSPPIVAEA